jgi:hypothetical protein
MTWQANRSAAFPAAYPRRSGNNPAWIGLVDLGSTRVPSLPPLRHRLIPPRQPQQYLRHADHPGRCCHRSVVDRQHAQLGCGQLAERSPVAPVVHASPYSARERMSLARTAKRERPVTSAPSLERRNVAASLSQTMMRASMMHLTYANRSSLGPTAAASHSRSPPSPSVPAYPTLLKRRGYHGNRCVLTLRYQLSAGRDVGRRRTLNTCPPIRSCPLVLLAVGRRFGSHLESWRATISSSASQHSGCCFRWPDAVPSVFAASSTPATSPERNSPMGLARLRAERDLWRAQAELRAAQAVRLGKEGDLELAAAYQAMSKAAAAMAVAIELENPELRS